ncbi:MAG TPA: M56 family metallopeptidase [Allosphingosinicella sp.]|jgi:beta-lactamase regulating signal transducer with metallopeptidase domain|nr:M56 family metallopeptidase [Allosphingosinicella sp.]
MNFDFLVEMAWKSALISGAALAVAAALRFRPAGERSAVLRTAVAMILALPLIVLLLPALPVVTQTIRETAPALPTALPPVDFVAAAPVAAPASSAWDSPMPVLEWLWLGGAALVVLRLLAGLATLRRWTRSASTPDLQWSAALDRSLDAAGCRKKVRLLVGDAPSPISWGWRRPVILLDGDTARNPSEAEAVLAHEVAHIVRHDWAMLIAARLAVACFWFNPLMWLLERRLVAEAEEAADARALASVEPETYAQTLLSCARQTGTPRLPATGIADRSLGRRVKTILARRLRVGAPDPRLVRAAMAVCALIAAPIAALKPVIATVYQPAAPQAPMPPAPAQPELAMAPPAPPAAPASAPAEAPEAAEAPVAPEVPEVPAAPPAPAAPAVTPIALASAAPPAPPAPPRAPRPPRDDWTGVDGREIADSVREAVRESLAASQEALREAARAQEQVRRELTPERMAEIRRAAEQARIAARQGLAAGAAGMEEGARGMEQGARQMDSEAEKLRSPEYRAEQIARSAREGRTVTDAELVAAIPKLHEGARKLREGAVRMRSEGEKMRRGG